MTHLDFKIALLRANISMNEIARRKNISPALVCLALQGKRNSKKAREIRKYVKQIAYRQAA